MKPILDRVIIKQDEAEQLTRGGIVLSTERKEQPKGEIVAIGPKVKELQVGQRVLFNINWKQTFKNDGHEFVTVNEGDILAILGQDVAVSQERARG